MFYGIIQVFFESLKLSIIEAQSRGYNSKCDNDRNHHRIIKVSLNKDYNIAFYLLHHSWSSTVFYSWPKPSVSSMA